jgi:kinesin family protein C2/C3
MEAEEELEMGDATHAHAARVLAIQQRMEAAALEVGSMTKRVLQPAGTDVADSSDQENASSPEEALCAAEAGDMHGHDALTLALTELKRALEHRERADAEVRSRAASEAQEEREKVRATLEAALHSKQQALEGQQEEVKQLQGAVARLQEEVSRQQQQLLEAQDAQHQVGLKTQENKELQAALEQEKELAKMRSRRLRGGIRTVQGQLGGVRAGFDELRTQVKEMTASILPDLSAMAGKLETSILSVAEGIQAELDETNGKFEGEVKERKRLHNLVQELKGNIRVFARIRPISAREQESSKKSVALCASDSELSLCTGGKMSMFNFDKVFGQDSTQEEVFEETGPLVVSVLDGYNVCIFAYGQTGSGKTHTMEGSQAMRGVNYRSLSMLFQLAHERRRIAKYEFKVSLLEIYNEQIKDLIESHDVKGELKKLDVKNDPNGGTYVAELKTSRVECIEDVLQVMSVGMRNRSTSSTNMNCQSSRSHCIFSVHVTCTDLLKGGTSFGKMHLVDLAGSERLSRTGAEGDRLTEAKNINKSLSALGNCISSLGTDSQKYSA